MTLFGYNILSIPDKAVFLAHIERLKPPALLFFQNELDFARQIKAQHPDIKILLRNWPDSDMYKRQTPDQWLNEHAPQSEGGITLVTTNEAGLGDDNIRWHVELMQKAAARKIPLCVLNPATGTWDTNDFPRLDPLLKLASDHRDLFVIGLHSYAGAVITSGLYGGLPNNAGVQIGEPGGKNLIPRAAWPAPADGITKFHIGRHEWLVDYCKQHGFNPRFGLTECGFDYLSDIGNWMNTLDRGSNTSVNGWHTLRTQWMKWWPEFSTAEKAYVEQFRYAAANLLKGLDFALFFAFGDDGNWTAYNVANTPIPALLEGIAAPAPVIIPIAPEKPVEPPVRPIDRPIAPPVPSNDPDNILDLPPTVQSHTYEVKISSNSPTGDLMARFLERVLAYSKTMFEEFVNDGLVQSPIQFEFKEVK